MTENFCVSHATRAGDVKLGYVGTVVEGVEQRIAESGEVLVKSPGTMLGYYKDQALTDATIGADQFLRTGDRGELDDAGRLRITGRVKELFKTSKGKYVAPAPIENLVAQHDDVEQALVAGAGQHQPFAMVVLSDAARNRPRRRARACSSPRTSTRSTPGSTRTSGSRSSSSSPSRGRSRTACSRRR